LDQYLSESYLVTFPSKHRVFISAYLLAFTWSNLLQLSFFLTSAPCMPGTPYKASFTKEQNNNRRKKCIYPL
jgi:hypothetical protein